MSTYRETASREADEKADEKSAPDGSEKKPLGAVQIFWLAVLSMYLWCCTILPFAISVWNNGLVKTLIATAPILGIGIVMGILLWAAWRVRAHAEARAPSFAKQQLARETEAFLTQMEDRAIHTRVFSPPAQPPTTHDPPHVGRRVVVSASAIGVVVSASAMGGTDATPDDHVEPDSVEARVSSLKGNR